MHSFFHVDLTHESVEAAVSILSKLTRLSRLHLEIIVSDCNGDFMVDLGPLHTLSVLQDLTVSSDSSLCLPVELSTLQNLMSLRLSGFDWHGEVDCGLYVDLMGELERYVCSEKFDPIRLGPPLHQQLNEADCFAQPFCSQIKEERTGSG